jgi:hypothetical protein
LKDFATIKHHQSLEYLQIRHVFLVQLGLFQAAFEMAAATDVAAMFRTGLGMEQMVAPPKHRSGGIACRICLKLAAEIDFGASLRGKLMSSHWLLGVPPFGQTYTTTLMRPMTLDVGSKFLAALDGSGCSDYISFHICLDQPKPRN